MRELTLHEKITLKGIFSRFVVLPRLDMARALRLCPRLLANPSASCSSSARGDRTAAGISTKPGAGTSPWARREREAPVACAEDVQRHRQGTAPEARRPVLVWHGDENVSMTTAGIGWVSINSSRSQIRIREKLAAFRTVLAACLEKPRHSFWSSEQILDLPDCGIHLRFNPNTAPGLVVLRLRGADQDRGIYCELKVLDDLLSWLNGVDGRQYGLNREFYRVVVRRVGGRTVTRPAGTLHEFSRVQLRIDNGEGRTYELDLRNDQARRFADGLLAAIADPQLSGSRDFVTQADTCTHGRVISLSHIRSTHFVLAIRDRGMGNTGICALGRASLAFLASRIHDALADQPG